MRVLRRSILLAAMIVSALLVLSAPLATAATKAQQDAWFKTAAGRYMNPDGAYLYQCVDVADDYCIALWGNYKNTIGTAMYAKDLFAKASTKYFDKVRNNPKDAKQIPKYGDIVVWAGTKPYSGGAGHIAVVYSATTANMQVMEQNWDPKRPGRTPCAKRTATYGHLIGWLRPKLTTPINPLADGQFVKTASSPAVYRIAGGSALWVSVWSAVGGAQRVNVISQVQLNSLRPYPADGTCLDFNGTVYMAVGGAPVVVTSWKAIGGARTTIRVDPWHLKNIGKSPCRLNAVPVNGSFLKAYDAKTIYVIAGGAPLPVSSWNAVGGAKPYTSVDPWVLKNLGNPAAHLNALPANGTFLQAKTATGALYGSYVVAGGAPLGISSWSVYGGKAPAGLTTIDAYAIQNRGKAGTQLLAVPADGTLVKGLPSGSYWSFAAGQRHPSAASAAAVAVDDLGLAPFPQYVPPVTDTLGPVTIARSAKGRKGHTVKLRFHIRDDLSSAAYEVLIVIRDRRSKAVAMLPMGTQALGVWHAIDWTPKKRGSFRMYVYAKDAANNVQSHVGSALVTVKR